MEEIAIFEDSPVPSEVTRAFEAFHELLAAQEKLLWKLVHRSINSREGTAYFEPAEIYTLLIGRIWKHADSFDPKGDDAEGRRKQFTQWAGSTLKNLLCDRATALRMEEDQLSSLAASWDEVFRESPEQSEKEKIVAEVLDEMDPDDAEILRWHAIVQPLDGSQMRPSAEDREALCRSLGVTPESLRQRRSRALKKLQAALRDRLDA